MTVWVAVACCALSALASAVLVAWLMRAKSAPTGAPTDPSAAIQVDTAQAQDTAESQAKDAAKAKAKEILNESDSDVAARVLQLRERGKSSE